MEDVTPIPIRFTTATTMIWSKVRLSNAWKTYKTMPNIFNFCLKQLNQILKAVVCIVAFIVSGQVWCDVFVDRTMLHTLDLTYAQDHLIFTLSLSLILLLSFPISLRNFIVFFFYLCSVLFLWRFLSLSFFFSKVEGTLVTVKEGSSGLLLSWQRSLFFIFKMF